MSQLENKVHPLQHFLCKGNKFQWDCLCQKSFEQVKTYLANPPILVPPVVGQPLILYISDTSVALGALLAQLDDNGNEKAIYYLSQTLVGYELNYTTIERACLVVVFCTQKLHHYMLNHTTYLIAKIDPLKYFLSKATLTS